MSAKLFLNYRKGRNQGHKATVVLIPNMKYLPHMV